jgi:hypothetical protein
VDRPFHRSIACWSILLVIVFICGASWTSHRYETWWRYDCIAAGNTHGGIEINSAYSGSGFTTWVNRMRGSLSAPLMPAPFILRGTGSPSAPITTRGAVSYRDSLEIMMTRRSPEAWLIFIPHWLILLAAVLLWVVPLRWRYQRRLAAQKESLLH